MTKKTNSANLAWAKSVIADFQAGDDVVRSKLGKDWETQVNTALLTVAGAGDVAQGRLRMLEHLEREIRFLSMTAIIQ